MSICKECGGDSVIADIARRMGHRPDVAYAEVRRLEDILFKLGAMKEPPCFVCGYNGPNYYQPEHHPCAKRHHEGRVPVQEEYKETPEYRRSRAGKSANDFLGMLGVID